MLEWMQGKGAHLFAQTAATTMKISVCVWGAVRQNIEIETGLPYDSVYHCWVYFK